MVALISAIISGILSFAAFPSYDLSFLIWFGMVPLLICLTQSRSVQGFFLSLLAGMVFFIGIFNWILIIPEYTYLHHTLLALYLGSYFGFFGFIVSLVSRRRGSTAGLIISPFIWISMEYFRSNFFFLALPWGLLAHSQYQNPMLIQAASFIGAYGVSFLIVLVNAAIAALCYTLYKGRSTVAAKTFNREIVVFVGTTAVIFIIILIYGYVVTSKTIVGNKLRISVVQGNIEQSKKWDPKYASMIMETYTELTQRVSKEKPDLIVWPETATPRAINSDPRLMKQVKQLVMSANTPLLLGSSNLSKYKPKDPKSAKYSNSAYLIPPVSGKRKFQRYDKILLFPFGEYLPMKKKLPWSFINIPDIKGFLPGKKFRILNLDGSRFAVTICWENIFPQIVRQFVKNRAQFIINITNEAWFGETAAPYQFLSMSIFRAVENGLYVIRCANTGISSFIDPCGRVIDRVKGEDGKDTFVKGFLTDEIVPLESNTIYTRYGDWFVWFCMIAAAIFILFAFVKPKAS